jgi:carbamoyl-phosphate synthase small subunit
VISDYSFNYSHWNAAKSLDQWLKEHQVPGIFGIDTRELTKTLRENGSMMGKIVQEECTAELACVNPNVVNQVDEVSCKEVMKYNEGKGKKVVLLDCGVKNSILRTLANKDVEVIRVPWNYNFNNLEYDGLIISNGPGNPDFCTEAVENIKAAMAQDKPVFGICMGNQLLGKAAGAKTSKLKFGHRTQNQPVRRVGTTTCYITTQNHGYALDATTLPSDWEPMFVNLNDGSNEGIRHKSKPFFSIQFQPDGVEFLFDEFIKML